MKFWKLLARAFGAAIAIVLVAGAVPSEAASIIYNVNKTIGTGTLTGTITTDAKIGDLDTSDVIAWSLTMTNGAAATRTLDQSNSAFTDQGSAFTSTSTGLFFNFGSTSQEFAYFSGVGFGGGLICMIAAGGCGNVNTQHAWSIEPNFPSGFGDAFSVFDSSVQIASVGVSAVPGPIVGAGLPGLAMAFGGLIAFGRKRRARNLERAA